MNAASAESSASIRCFIRDSDATRARSSCGCTGFDRNSSAPASMPLMRSDMSDCPVTSTTGVNRVAGSAFSRRQTSRPSSLRHLNVEQDDVRMLLLHGVERLGAVLDGDDVVPLGKQKFAEEGANALGVVGDEHTAAPRHGCGRVDHTCSTS